MLDTNVVLTGAFSPNSHAGALWKLKKEVSFLVCSYVWEEIVRQVAQGVRKAIDRDPEDKEIDPFLRRIEEYLCSLGCMKIPGTGMGRSSVHIRDTDDQPIHDAARHAGCEYICTYNIKDFQSGEVDPIPPHALLSRYGKRAIYIEYPVLGYRGTLFMILELQHPSSLGDVLRFADGATLFGDAKGRLLMKGPHVQCRPVRKNKLPAHETLSLFFRYKPTGEFECLYYTNRRKEAIRLSSGKFRPKVPVEPLLFFGKSNHGFFGRVRHVAGTPKYHRHIELAVRYECLDAIAGSEDIIETITCLTRFPQMLEQRLMMQRYLHIFERDISVRRSSDQDGSGR